MQHIHGDGADSVSWDAVCLGLVFLLRMHSAPHRGIADARPLELLTSSYFPPRSRALKSVSTSLDTSSLPVDVHGSSLPSFRGALMFNGRGQPDCDDLLLTLDPRYAVRTASIGLKIPTFR